MNAWGVIVIWGIVQVTVITLFAMACYALLRNRAPAARSQVIVVGLCVTLLVSVLAHLSVAALGVIVAGE